MVEEGCLKIGLEERKEGQCGWKQEVDWMGEGKTGRWLVVRLLWLEKKKKRGSWK